MPYIAKRAITLTDGMQIDRGSVIAAADIGKLPGRLLQRGLRRKGRKPRLGYRLPVAGEPQDIWIVAGTFKQMVNDVVQRLPLGTELPDINKSKAFHYLVRSGRIALKASSPSVEKKKQSPPVPAAKSKKPSRKKK